MSDVLRIPGELLIQCLSEGLFYFHVHQLIDECLIVIEKLLFIRALKNICLLNNMFFFVCLYVCTFVRINVCVF